MTTEDSRVRFTFRVPDALYVKLKEEASRTGHSVNAVILNILEQWRKTTAET